VPIVTISQIKHRRGISGTAGALGTQLASAELGWSVDQQELYVGNGSIAEGAPAIGNTEILTEHSNLTALLSDYTYAGPFSGAVMQTGVGAGSPIIRTNDDHDDDRVNVRSFGAIGAGGPSDLAALKRAIYQHTSQAPVNNQYWTTIYVPAGTYNIDGPLQLPSRVRLVGDGYNSTIINLTTGSAAVLEFGETVDPAPSDIYISGIGFTATSTTPHVCTIHDANNIIFDRCAFTGAQTDTISDPSPNGTACVLFSNLNVNLPTYDIKFLNCLFTKSQYGITSDIPGGADSRQDISNVVVENCIFDDLYKGIVVGPNVDISTTTTAGSFIVGTKYRIVSVGTTDFTLIGASANTIDIEFVATGVGSGTGTASFTIPTNWRVSVSLFDNITAEGIHCFQTNKFTSSLNHFKDVGNLQAATPTYSNIVIGDSGGLDPTVVSVADYEGNYSIGDTFDRTDADDATIKRITTNCYNSYVIDPSSIRYGVFHVEPGRLIRLADNTVAATATGIALDSDLYHGAIIDYQINRGANIRRIGTLTLVIGEAAAGQSMSEDFVEATTTTGITFSLATTVDAGGDIATVEFTSTSTGSAAILSYSIRHLTCILVTP